MNMKNELKDCSPLCQRCALMQAMQLALTHIEALKKENEKLKLKGPIKIDIPNLN